MLSKFLHLLWKPFFPRSDTRPTQVRVMDPWPVTWPNLSDLIGWGQKISITSWQNIWYLLCVTFATGIWYVPVWTTCGVFMSTMWPMPGVHTNVCHVTYAMGLCYVGCVTYAVGMWYIPRVTCAVGLHVTYAGVYITENKRSSIWQLCHHWWYRGLS